MRYLALLFLTAAVLAGCAQEAYYADREYGIATKDAFDQQVVNKDYVHAGKTSDSMDGLHAEPIMEMYHDSFGEGFTQESVSTSSPGSSN
jgi:hypothetical protein